jgi:hypothetical protein
VGKESIERRPRRGIWVGGANLGSGQRLLKCEK